MSSIYYLLYRLQNIHSFGDLIGALLALALFAFAAWMIIDCLQNGREYYWFWVIMMTGGLGAFIYFYRYLWNGSLLDSLPLAGFTERRKIKELKSRIHFFDQAPHHQELGDIYMRLGKLAEAESSYRTALKLDPNLFDASVGLGYTLLAQKKADEAWTYLRPAYVARPTYDEDELLWQCARCQLARGEYEESQSLYEYFLSKHSYYAAQVEYAQLMAKMGNRQKAMELLHEISDDIRNSPRYVQRREGRWGRQARKVLRELTAGK